MLFYAISLALSSADPTPNALLAQVQKRYESFADFSAEFKQTLVRAARPGKGRTESGKVYLKRPGLMRWDYAEPEVKNFVIDGERLWAYKPDEAEVMVYDKFHEAEVSAGLSFLWGKAALDKEFDAKHESGNDPLGAPFPPRTLKLIPKKPDANVKTLYFTIDDKNFISKAVVEDQVGNFNIFDFKNVMLDKGLKKDAFLFVPPDGVKVVHVD